jgi:hypothetical protein
MNRSTCELARGLVDWCAPDGPRRGRFSVGHDSVGFQASVGKPLRTIQMTKVMATIEVEFELAEGQAENAATAALARGVGMLAHSIEYGATGSEKTGVKRGSVRANITDQIIRLG